MAPGKVRPAAVVTIVPELDSTTRLVWKAPMSTTEPRVSPRWSVVTPLTAVPMPMAALPASRAMVWVGPPLLASGARPRLVRLVRTMFPFCPLVSPPEPPVPIRLFEPDTVPGPPMSLAPAGFVLPATIVL